MLFHKMLAAAAVLFTLAADPAFAANFEVKMLNKGANGDTMVFEPALIRVAVGDTVTFIPTDKGHNAEAIAKFLPEGAEIFKGKVGAELVVTLTVPGVYGIKCMPHYAMGMIAVIVVGEDLGNLDAVKAMKHPKMAQARFDAIYAELATP